MSSEKSLGARERLLWVMVKEPTLTQGIPFRFWKLHPWRVFGFELIVVQERKS